MSKEENIEDAMLPFKVQQLAETIMHKKSIGFEDALRYLYSSNLYLDLMSPEKKLWYESSPALYLMLEKEKKGLKGIHSQEQLFVIFCLENYKKKYGQTAEETLCLFSKYCVTDFLQHNFEVLHTQGKEYILREIEDFLSVRKEIGK